jgi:protein-tyrosine phosphatase
VIFDFRFVIEDGKHPRRLVGGCFVRRNHRRLFIQSQITILKSQMLPLIDTHVHLLAGRDDGPPDDDTALAMCRMLVAEGARSAAALAHQNAIYPENTAAELRTATERLAGQLKAEKIPLTVRPTGEAMASADLPARLASGELLTVADRGKFLLVEQPHGLFLDLLPLAAGLRAAGVRMIVAHAERYPELLHDHGLTAQLIAAGCLIQVTARGLADPPSAADERALKAWVTGGYVHLLGSDGHNLERRQPRLRAGHAVLARWAGSAAADRIGHIWAAAVLDGRPVTPPPAKPKASWFARLLGGGA